MEDARNDLWLAGNDVENWRPLMTNKEILTKVRELLFDPTRWTKGAFSRRVDGSDSGPGNTAKGATCYCLIGAIQKVSGWCDVSPITGYLWIALPGQYFDVASFNDAPGRTHEEILALLDKAIETA